MRPYVQSSELSPSTKAAKCWVYVDLFSQVWLRPEQSNILHHWLTLFDSYPQCRAVTAVGTELFTSVEIQNEQKQNKDLTKENRVHLWQGQIFMTNSRWKTWMILIYFFYINFLRTSQRQNKPSICVLQRSCPVGAERHANARPQKQMNAGIISMRDQLMLAQTESSIILV